MTVISSSVSCGVSTAVGSSRISSSRVAAERLEDLDPLLHADRQVGDQRVGRDVEAVPLRDLARPRAGRAAGRAGRRAVVCSWPSMTFSATVNTGMSMKCWCTMPMPAAIASPGPLKRDRLVVDEDLALVGLVQPVEDVHQGATCRRRSRRAARGSRPARRPGRRESLAVREPKRLVMPRSSSFTRLLAAPSHSSDDERAVLRRSVNQRSTA